MTSPTDLAERLRRNIAPIVGPWRRDEWDTLKEAADALDRLSALESAASGAVTDEEANLTSLIGELGDIREDLRDSDDRAAVSRAIMELRNPAKYRHHSNVLTVTDSEIAEVIRFLRIARVCGHPPECHDECGGLQPPIMAVAADLLERLAPRLAKAEQRCRDLEAENERWRGAENNLSLAYVRLRGLIPGAFDTPPGPTGEQVWAHTEACLSRALAASSEPAPSDGAYADHFKNCDCPPSAHDIDLTYCTNCGAHCFGNAQRMAMDDAKKGKVSDG